MMRPADDPNQPATGPTAAKQSARVRAEGLTRPWTRHLAFKNIGVLYVWVAIIGLFSVLAPSTFPQWATVQSILNQNAVAGLMALALVVPLAARVFDLSVGSALGLANIIIAWLLTSQGVPVVPAVLLTVGAGAMLGVFNAVVVVLLRVDSFIATLATGSLMTAAVSLISHDESIFGPRLAGSFGTIATASVGGIAVPVFLMVGIAFGLWYVLTYTTTGREIYATGFNEKAARLIGINTQRVRFVSLLFSGTVAAVAGAVLASQISSGSPGVGPPYLLGAFAAAFLGATQLGGRFNAWGTVVAVLLLGTGQTGLVLIGAPTWASSMFTGSVLLAALILTRVETRGVRRHAAIHMRGHTSRESGH